MKKTDQWYRRSGNEGDVVISTRVRLARNLSTTPFPASLTADQKEAVVQRAAEALQAETEYGPFGLIHMAGLPQREALAMVERHLISPEFCRCDEGSALLLSGDESIGIMVNEEDHFRLQVMRPGLDLSLIHI